MSSPLRLSPIANPRFQNRRRRFRSVPQAEQEAAYQVVLRVGPPISDLLRETHAVNTLRQGMVEASRIGAGIIIITKANAKTRELETFCSLVRSEKRWVKIYLFSEGDKQNLDWGLTGSFSRPHDIKLAAAVIAKIQQQKKRKT